MSLRAASLSFLLLAAACAGPSGFVISDHVSTVPLEVVAANLASADVVVLGEEHDSLPAHRAHWALVEELHELRPDLAISLEMFERDVQDVLSQYLAGLMDEEEFLAKSRPWPHYAEHYRPFVEFAKERGLPVIAANAPRPLARQVSREGLDSVRGNPHVARECSAPDDDYRRAFVETMEEHMGTGSPEAMQRMYVSQCLKDDTMAESIADFLREAAREGRNPLVVHVVGKFHSDHRLGTVMRLEQRLPGADIRVLTVATSPDPELAIYTTTPRLADYVVVVQEQPPAPKAATPAGPLPSKHPPVAGGAKPEGLPPVRTEPPAPPAPELAPTGRPALGVKPDYEFVGEGLRIEDVVAGGGAEAGGIEPGDIVVAMGGERVDNVQDYMLVLSSLTPGAEIEITVLRGETKQKLKRKVKVGTRAQ